MFNLAAIHLGVPLAHAQDRCQKRFNYGLPRAHIAHQRAPLRRQLYLPAFAGQNQPAFLERPEIDGDCAASNAQVVCDVGNPGPAIALCAQFLNRPQMMRGAVRQSVGFKSFPRFHFASIVELFDMSNNYRHSTFLNRPVMLTLCNIW